MNLSDKERAVIERMRANEREKRGTVPCYDCAGTGSYSQSNCEVCDGSGELKRNGPEIQRAVRDIEARRKAANDSFDRMARQIRGEK